MRSLRLFFSVCTILLCGFAAHRQMAQRSATRAAAPTPLILEKDQGEKRIRRPIDGSSPAASIFFLKVDPQNGASRRFVMGLEEMAPGGVIPMHKHLAQDEILFLEDGIAHVTLGSRQQDVHGGATVFIPQGTWISVKNIGAQPIRVLFVFSNPGYETYMRCTSVPYGQPVKPLSLKQRDACMAQGEVMYK